MKKAELLKLLEQIPEDAEIVVDGYHDDIMGEYTYKDKLQVDKTKARLSQSGVLRMNICNYTTTKDLVVEVWHLS